MGLQITHGALQSLLVLYAETAEVEVPFVALWGTNSMFQLHGKLFSLALVCHTHPVLRLHGESVLSAFQWRVDGLLGRIEDPPPRPLVVIEVTLT